MPTEIRRLLGAALLAAAFAAAPAAAQAPQGPWLVLAPFPVPSAARTGDRWFHSGLTRRRP